MKRCNPAGKDCHFSALKLLSRIASSSRGLWRKARNCTKLLARISTRWMMSVSKSGTRSFTSASRSAVRDRQVCLTHRVDSTSNSRCQTTFIHRRFFRLIRFRIWWRHQPLIRTTMKTRSCSQASWPEVFCTSKQLLSHQDWASIWRKWTKEESSSRSDLIKLESQEASKVNKETSNRHACF